MSTFQGYCPIVDSGRSSRLSILSSDGEDLGVIVSRNSNYDKYFTYGSNDNKSSRHSYCEIRRSHNRQSSRFNIQSNLVDHFSIVGGGKDPDGFVRKNKDEDCLKCMLKIAHRKCESHKYIRVGGGYRHSYYYVIMLLENIELKKQKDELLRRRLEVISEGNPKTYKAYIRNNSGKLIVKMIYLSNEDYLSFNDALVKGEDTTKILENYLTKDEMQNLDAYDKEEQQAIKTFIRSGSGKLIEKIIYLPKVEYTSFKQDYKYSNKVIQKRLKLKSNEKLEGWKKSDPRMMTVKIRTKSGRIIEKQIPISEEDYEKLQTGNSDDVMRKYMGNDPDSKILGWEKSPSPKMNAFKTLIRTKSGRLIEKTILMTDEEMKEFEKSKGDSNFLKKYLDLKDGETIDNWEKSAPAYESSDEEFNKAKPGQKIKQKDGKEYEVLVDPLTGKKYKQLAKNMKNPTLYNAQGKRDLTEKDVQKRKDFKEGRRDKTGDSDFNYKSYTDADGKKHVITQKKNPDGTYENVESYHGNQDEDGKTRKLSRMMESKQGIESAHSYMSVRSEREQKDADNAYAAARSNEALKEILKIRKREDSDNSYFSETSANGTKKQIKRKRIRDEHGNIIGYGKNVEHDGKGQIIDKNDTKKRREHDSGSNYSYFSDVSIGGTHYQKRKKKIRDKNGKVIGYRKEEDYSSDSGKSFISVSDGKGGKMKVPNPKKKPRSFSNVFSDATTDSDIVKERLKNMTKEEKQKYLEERAKRMEEREQKRKEKYGDKYDEMAQIYKKKKDEYKEKVEKEKLEKSEKKLKLSKKSKIQPDDGNEADNENENDDDVDAKSKKKNQKTAEELREIDSINDTNKEKDQNTMETESDKSKNILNKKPKDPEFDNDANGDADYFEIGTDGKYKLKRGIKNIDVKNLTTDELIKLGIDPNLSKAEQSRLLKEMFGDGIEIVFDKKKIGLKNIDDYDPNVSIDFLVNESDLDIDTVNPEQRVKIILKRGGNILLGHMKFVIESSMLDDFQSNGEKNSTIDFLATYRLVDPQNLEKYVRYYAIEDHDDLNCIISYKGCRNALVNLKRTQVINNLTEKQIDYILLALNINKYTEISFRMFSVIAALGDRMTKLDSYCRDLLEISDLLDIERKLKFYRELFHMNERSDRDSNYVKVDSISIDLKAGGLNDDQQKFVLSKLRLNEVLEISFLDFLSYIPLFMSYHDNIVDNPLDSSSNKYLHTNKRRASIQRDMNPLGYNLSRNTQFYKKSNNTYLSKNRNNSTPHTDTPSNLNIIGKAKEKLSRYPVLPGINHLV